MYLLKLALRPWRIAPVTQLLSCCVVALLLLLAGLLFWFERGLGPLTAQLSSDQVITAYIASSVKAEETGKILEQIKQSVGGAEVKLVNALGFVDEIKTHYPELSRQLEDLGSEIDTVVPRYISVSGNVAPDVLQKLKSIQGIESAESSRERFLHIVGAFQAVKKLAAFLVLGLCLALLAGLVQLARINSYIHSDALSLLRLWGAGGATLRVPGILAGVWIGSVGGALAGAGWLSTGTWLSAQLRTLSPMLTRMPDPAARSALYLILAGGALGLLSGLIAATPSSRSAEGRG